MLGADGMVQLLQGLTPALACCSAVLAILSVAGNSWLLTQESFSNPAYINGSSRIQYFHKKTVSGLFLFCQTEVGSDVYECASIDYFNQDRYRPDAEDATLAIPYTAVRSSPFFLCGLVVLVVAEVMCACGYYRRHGSRVYTFAAGVTFIMQGLLMMMGCVMYIATLKGEVWQKLQPISTYTPAPFVYSYGFNFVLLIVSFTSSELAGFCSIMLFIYWYKRDWMRGQKGAPSETSSPHPSCHHSMLAQLHYTSAGPSTPAPSTLSCPLLLQYHNSKHNSSTCLAHSLGPNIQLNCTAHSSTCLINTINDSRNMTSSENNIVNLCELGTLNSSTHNTLLTSNQFTGPHSDNKINILLNSELGDQQNCTMHNDGALFIRCNSCSHSSVQYNQIHSGHCFAQSLGHDHSCCHVSLMQLSKPDRPQLLKQNSCDGRINAKNMELKLVDLTAHEFQNERTSDNLSATGCADDSQDQTTSVFESRGGQGGLCINCTNPGMKFVDSDPCLEDQEPDYANISVMSQNTNGKYIQNFGLCALHRKSEVPRQNDNELAGDGQKLNNCYDISSSDTSTEENSSKLKESIQNMISSIRECQLNSFINKASRSNDAVSFPLNSYSGNCRGEIVANTVGDDEGEDRDIEDLTVRGTETVVVANVVPTNKLENSSGTVPIVCNCCFTAFTPCCCCCCYCLQHASCCLQTCQQTIDCLSSKQSISTSDLSFDRKI